ncbi:MAG: helix-turn-helix domain-containing protein [Dehalogenimonas sp.]
MPRERIEKTEKDVERVYLTFTEAQRCLGVSHDTLYKLMKQGLPSHKVGRKRVFLHEELEQWVKEH